MTISDDVGGILILSATLGAGHHRAAEAVAGAVQRINPGVPAEELDFFDFVSPAMNRFVRNLYVFSVKNTPSLYQLFYTSTGKIRPRSPFQRYLNAMGRDGLKKLIEQKQPRAIINTFPTPSGTISTLRERFGIQIPNVNVITDHTVHSQWIHPGVDRYYVGSEEIKEGMVQRGIPDEKVLVSGIPVHPAFGDPVDERAVRKQYGIGDGPVVLLMAGAYGMIGGFSEVVHRVAEQGPSATYVAITGHDRALKESLEAVRGKTKNPLLPLGYTREVWDLMGIADILVSKAGGLTTSEAMARSLPMAIFRPIPGQEMANVKLVLGRGAGFWAKTTDELIQGLSGFFDRGEERARMVAAAKSLGRPQAAEMIAHDVLDNFC